MSCHAGGSLYQFGIELKSMPTSSTSYVALFYRRNKHELKDLYFPFLVEAWARRAATRLATTKKTLVFHGQDDHHAMTKISGLY